MYRPQLRYPHFKKTVNHILCWQDSQKHPWDLCSQPLKEVFCDLAFIFLVGFGRVFSCLIQYICIIVRYVHEPWEIKELPSVRTQLYRDRLPWTRGNIFKIPENLSSTSPRVPAQPTLPVSRQLQGSRPLQPQRSTPVSAELLLRHAK